MLQQRKWSESEIDVVLLDDHAWTSASWVEDFISRHLSSCTSSTQQARFRELVKALGIKSEAQLFEGYVSLKLPSFWEGIIAGLIQNSPSMASALGQRETGPASRGPEPPDYGGTVTASSSPMRQAQGAGSDPFEYVDASSLQAEGDAVQNLNKRLREVEISAEIGRGVMTHNSSKASSRSFNPDGIQEAERLLENEHRARLMDGNPQPAFQPDVGASVAQVSRRMGNVSWNDSDPPSAVRKSRSYAESLLDNETSPRHLDPNAQPGIEPESVAAPRQLSGQINSLSLRNHASMPKSRSDNNEHIRLGNSQPLDISASNKSKDSSDTVTNPSQHAGSNSSACVHTKSMLQVLQEDERVKRKITKGTDIMFKAKPIQELSDALKQHNVIPKYLVGYGAYGWVVSVLANGKECVAKVEISTEVDGRSALEREVGTVSMNRVRHKSSTNNPMPKLECVLNGSPYGTLALKDGSYARVAFYEYLESQPQEILQQGETTWADYKRADPYSRHVILKTADALMFMSANGLVHGDIKHEHLMYRWNGTNSDLVIVDWGFAETRSRNYTPKSRLRIDTPNREANLRQTDLRCALPILPRKLERIAPADGKGGTPFYRMLYGARSHEERQKGDHWALGIIVLSQMCPFSHFTNAEEFEEFVHRIVDLNFDRFVGEVLGLAPAPVKAVASKRSRDVLKLNIPLNADGRRATFDPCFGMDPYFGMDILELAYHLLRPDPAERWGPVEVLNSSFARNYIPFDWSWFEKVVKEGIVVWPRQLASGKDSIPILLLWLKNRGFTGISLLVSDVDTAVNDYSGLTEQVMNNCAGTLSLHSIGIRDGFVLNGTPCKEFTPEYMSENASTGSLFRSSNIDPNDSHHGNIKQPDRLNQRTKEFPDGRKLDCIPLITSKPCPFGVEYAYAYPWSQASRNLQVYTEEQIKEGIRVFQKRFDPETRALILKQRKAVLDKGYKDANPPHCTRSVCLKGFRSECAKECFFMWTDHDIDACKAAFTGLGAKRRHDQYWAMPDNMSDEQRKDITVLIDSSIFNSTDQGGSKALNDIQDLIQKKLKKWGCAVVDNFFGQHPDGEALMTEVLTYAASRQFADCSSQNTSTVKGQKHLIDTGDKSKRFEYSQETTDPVGKLCKTAASVLLTKDYRVAETVGPRGKRHANLCLVRQDASSHLKVFKRHQINGCVIQPVHCDSDAFGDEGDGRALQLIRKNVTMFRQQRGPISMWISLAERGKTLSLVLFLCSHTHVLECLELVARHYAPALDDYLRRHPEATENDFEPIWIGAVITTMKERHPEKSVGAVALPVEGGGVVLMDGLTLHSGTDETGLRAFACFTLPVSILFFSFKICLALTARYDKQGFIHPHNQFHIVPDSVALAGLLHSVLKPLNIKDIPTIRPDDDSEDVSAATGTLTFTYPSKSSISSSRRWHSRQVATAVQPCAGPISGSAGGASGTLTFTYPSKPSIISSSRRCARGRSRRDDAECASRPDVAPGLSPGRELPLP